MATSGGKVALIRNVFFRLTSIFIFLLVYVITASADPAVNSLSTEGVSLVVIKMINGAVKIYSWDKPEVSIKASLGDNEEPKEVAVEKMEKSGDRIEIKLGRMAEGMGECNVLIPENMDIEVDSMNGPIYVTGIKGKEKLSTVNGNIEISEVTGSISARTFNGSIRADIRFDDKSSFSTISGSIDINIKDEFSVPITAETQAGSVKVTVPKGFPADIDAETSLGLINCYIDLDGTIKDRSIKGKIFGGGALLKIRTLTGAITLGLAGEGSEAKSETGAVRREIKHQVLPRIEAARTLDPPVLDGKLNDKCWKSAGKIENFVWADGIGKPNEATEAYLLWDDRNLYIGVKCYESNMDAVKISNTEKDNDVWEDDMIQIFIKSSPDTEKNYYHLAVNPIGSLFDAEISKVEGRKHYRSPLGIKWNSDGLFRTDIGDSFWNIEANIPLSSIKAVPEEGSVLRFNIYRMEQRRKEHSYWSPIYAPADWPHVPDKFGELVFVGIAQNITPELPTSSESGIIISDIIVEGNNHVPQEEILDALRLKQGDMVDVESLSIAKLRLESLGFFQNIGMELVEKDEMVDLVVRVLEKEFITPAEVKIQGTTVFTAEQLADYFNLTTATTTKQDLDVKSKRISELYRVKGYEIASANCSVISNALVINVDEGHIDKVEIRGNKKIRTKDIISSLNLKPGMILKRGDIDNAIGAMRYNLPYFRSVEWKSEKSKDGLNIVYIDVKEGDLFKFPVNGITEFDRVHGLQLGSTAEASSAYQGVKAYCTFRYGCSSEIWNFQAGFEKSWFRRYKSSIGADIHRITDTNDRDIISDAEHFIAEFFLGEAFRDFYEREGYELKVSQKLNLVGELSVKYRDDEYSSLPKTNDWSMLNRSYAHNDDHRDHEVKYKRINPPIDNGRMRSVIAEYCIDTRNEKHDPSDGWLSTFSVESAGEQLGGDFDFKLYQADIRNYSRLSGRQFLTFRVKAAKANWELPLQRKLYLGGIGTLRGYPFKAFEGDKMVLINAEYWVKALTDLVFFIDSGYTWKHNQEMNAKDMKTDIGIGIQLANLRINAATPLEEGKKETILSFRLARMF